MIRCVAFLSYTRCLDVAYFPHVHDSMMFQLACLQHLRSVILGIIKTFCEIWEHPRNQEEAQPNVMSNTRL